MPEGNISAENLPEIRIDHSKKERKNMSKVTVLPYGTYFFEVVVSDKEGNRAKKVFKVWAYPNTKRCKIRSVYPHEQLMLMTKSLLAPV